MDGLLWSSTDLMSLLLAILANGRWLIGAVSGAVTDLLADTASTSELTSNSLIVALLLGMSV